MRIFDGPDEIEILPWYKCKDCTNHLHFHDQLSAQFFLRPFRSREVAMDSLRRLIREGRADLGLHSSQVIDHVAQMLANGELHATWKRLILGTGTTEPKEESWQPQPAPEPVSRPPAAEPPPPPPEEPVFLPDVDPVAIAQVLTQAALSGVPFCEE